MATVNLTSTRLHELAKLGVNEEILSHIYHRFAQLGINQVSKDEFSNMIEKSREFISERLNRAYSGKFPPMSAVASFDDYAKARTSASLPKFESIDALIFIDEFNNPRILYQVDGKPLHDWLTTQEQSIAPEQAVDVLNDNLINSLANIGVTINDGQLSKDGKTLSVEEVRNYVSQVSNQAFKNFTNKASITVNSTAPSESRQIAKQVENDNKNPYAGVL